MNLKVIHRQSEKLYFTKYTTLEITNFETKRRKGAQTYYNQLRNGYTKNCVLFYKRGEQLHETPFHRI